MNSTRVGAYLSGFLLISLIAVTSTAFAQPIFSHSLDPDARIISYSETPQMLGNPDRTPRIQVFGDGWVWVHYPLYMKKAGDYGIQLNPGELRQLLLALSGIFDFDRQAVGQAKKAIKAAREQQTGIMHYRSEDTLEEIALQLDGFQANPGAAARSIDLQLSWKNIASDARNYPELAELQKLNGARNSIRALLERDDLLRVDAGAGNE